MRFRLGIGGNQQQATDGFARGMQSLAMLPMLRAQAAEEAQGAEMKRQLMTSQQRQADAHAALYGAQAEAERTQLQRGSVGELLKSAALQRGVPLHQLDEATQFLQTGQLAGKYELPGGVQGPILPKPEYADPGVGAKIMQTLGLTQQALTTGDKSVENIAKATGLYQQQGNVDRVIAAPRDAGRVGQAYAAVEGKPLVQNIGNTGEGFNQFTGQGTTLNQGLRVLFDRGENAQISQRNAAAENSRAAAEENRAQTRKINQEAELGARTGDLQVVTGQDGTVTVVNKRTLSAQPVLDSQGRPVVKGSAGGGGKPMTEGQAKANMFGGRMTESDAVLSRLEDEGVTNSGVIKNVVQGTVGILPLVGDKLSEAAGSGMNVLPGVLGGPSSQQQQVEQARRDFINAVLRRESGAVISPQEFANAEKQYFPQPGDSKDVLAQKRRNRKIATTLMLQEVPEVHRYRPGPAATPAAPAAPGGSAPEGSWGAPAGWSIQKVN